MLNAIASKVCIAREAASVFWRERHGEVKVSSGEGRHLYTVFLSFASLIY
jgi:hypothetical protein